MARILDSPHNSWSSRILAHSTSILALCVVVVLSTHARAFAQEPEADTDPPPHIAVIDGSASVEREGRVEPATSNAPLEDGDRIRTTEGRVEIILSDGSVLQLDRFTAIDLMSSSLLRLLEGRVSLTVVNDPRGAIRYRIDAPGASAQIESAGEYRVSVLSDGSGRAPVVELGVVRGWAQLSNDRGLMPVRAGERSVARLDDKPSMPLAFYVATVAINDAFERWSEARRAVRTGVVSTQYLPRDLYNYAGAFDRNGYWGQQDAHGWVWYPTVSYGWRPYSAGGWWPYRRHGLVWVGSGAWDWPTHHYGRWGVTGVGNWFWIPGRRWASAWVSWGSAPDYFAWCPLGYNGLPVIGFSGYAARGIYDPWRAWTVVHRSSFAYATPVHRGIVSGRSLAPHVRGAFVVHNATPPGLPAGRYRASTGPSEGRGRSPVDHVAVPRSAPSGNSRRQPGPARGYEGGIAPGQPGDRQKVQQGQSAPSQGSGGIGGQGAGSRRGRIDGGEGGMTAGSNPGDRQKVSPGQPAAPAYGGIGGSAGATRGNGGITPRGVTTGPPRVDRQKSPDGQPSSSPVYGGIAGPRAGSDSSQGAGAAGPGRERGRVPRAAPSTGPETSAMPPPSIPRGGSYDTRAPRAPEAPDVYRPRGGDRSRESAPRAQPQDRPDPYTAGSSGPRSGPSGGVASPRSPRERPPSGAREASPPPGAQKSPAPDTRAPRSGEARSGGSRRRGG